MPASSRAERKHKKRRHPNFRDFSVDEDPLNPRSFSMNPNPDAARQDIERNTANTFFAQGPVGEPIEYVLEDLLTPSEDLYDPRHPPHVSEVAEDAFTATTSAAILDPSVDPAVPNFSQTGIVHLAPLDSYPRSHSSSRPRPGHSADRTSSPVRPLDAIDRDMNIVHLPSTRPDSMTSASASGYASGGGSGSAYESAKSSSGSSSEGPQITFRYQHMEDDDGHHLIVGREGKLTKCEDEVRPPSSLTTCIVMHISSKAHSHSRRGPRFWRSYRA